MQQASAPRYSHDSNLSAGSLAEPGIYVVSHQDQAHVAPHEVTIRSLMVLPHCKTCSNVRFSLKCSLPQNIEESDFFFDVNPALPSLFTRVLAKTAAVRLQAEQSRDMIRQSRELLLAHQAASSFA